MTQAFDFTAPDSYILNCSTLLTELPVLERAQAAKDAGFDRVEFCGLSTATRAPPRRKSMSSLPPDAAGVELAGLNFWAGNMAGGDRAWSPSSALKRISQQRRHRRRDRPPHRLPGLQRLYGLRTEGQDADGQDATAVANLSLAANAVAAIGGTVLVEPVSGAEAYPLSAMPMPPRWSPPSEPTDRQRRRPRRLLPHERQR